MMKSTGAGKSANNRIPAPFYKGLKMNKVLALVFALLFQANANAATTLFEQIKTNGKPSVSAVVLMDANGNSISSLSTSGSPSIPQAVSILASVAIDTATTTQVFWTQTPVALNLSTSAGVAGKKYIVTFQPNFGGAGMFVDFSILTWTAAINSGYGCYLPTTLTGGVAYGPYVAGFHAIAKASTATGVSGVVRVEALP